MFRQNLQVVSLKWLLAKQNQRKGHKSIVCFRIKTKGRNFCVLDLAGIHPGYSWVSRMGKVAACTRGLLTQQQLHCHHRNTQWQHGSTTGYCVRTQTTEVHTECKLEIHKIPRHNTCRTVPIQRGHKLNCAMLQCIILEKHCKQTFKYENMTCTQHIITENFLGKVFRKPKNRFYITKWSISPKNVFWLNSKIIFVGS